MGTPRPQSINNFSEPASTSVLGPNLSTVGIGLPVPRRVTLSVCACSAVEPGRRSDTAKRQCMMIRVMVRPLIGVRPCQARVASAETHGVRCGVHSRAKMLRKCARCYSGRTYVEGKKITWRDGMAALFHILRYNLFA